MILKGRGKQERQKSLSVIVLIFVVINCWDIENDSPD